MAKPSPASTPPRLLVLELWGLGDVALAIPFLRAASTHTAVTLLAKPHAAPLLERFAPEVQLIECVAPWTAFRGKYRLHRWPWRTLFRTMRTLRSFRFDLGVSARRDPRDHALLLLAGARRRLGYPRGSALLLHDKLPLPARPHRSEHWLDLAHALGFPPPPTSVLAPSGRKIVLHTGAGHPVRAWPSERFSQLAQRLHEAGWKVTTIDDSHGDLPRLLDTLMTADRFIGNDSGPGHIAALIGIPTFTIFGPQLPELFAPRHPGAAWIEGAPCPYKPCFDACRFPAPFCIRSLDVETVWRHVQQWLATPPERPA